MLRIQQGCSTMVKLRGGESKKTKMVVAAVAASAVLTVARPALVANVYAANVYEWTKLEDLNLYGGSYTSAAMSASGTHLILGVQDGGENSGEDLSPLYISNDSGATWENVAEEVDPGIRNSWSAVDVSDDGQTMLAVSEYAWDEVEENSTEGKVFISQDGGDTWGVSSIMGGDDWQDAALSGDGSTIILVRPNTGNLTVSENTGDTWGNVLVDDGDDEALNLKSVSISDDGEKMLVGGENGDSPYTKLYITTNGGAGWDDRTPNPSDDNWTNSHALSNDGSRMAVSTRGDAGGGNDSVFTSENNGAAWEDSDPEVPNTNLWIETAMSDDGAVMSVLDEEGSMYISGDFGQTWAAEDPDQGYTEESYWESLDTNEDGTRWLVAGEDNAYLNYAPESSGGSTATLVDAEGGKAIQITTPDGTTITCSSAVKESVLSVQDSAYKYPLGLVDFCFDTEEESNVVTLTFVTNLKPEEVVIRKYNPDTQEYDTVSDASVTETTYQDQAALQVSYTIVDNGPLDLDPDVGEIADPVGIGITEARLAETGDSTATYIFIATTLLAMGFGTTTMQRLKKREE